MTCKNCKYSSICGDSERTAPCNGYESRFNLALAQRIYDVYDLYDLKDNDATPEHVLEALEASPDVVIKSLLDIIEDLQGGV